MTHNFSTPYLACEQILAALGTRIRNTRLGRDYTMLEVSRRAGVSRETLSKVESGEPSVSMGTYIKVLHILGLRMDFNLLTQDDLAEQNLVNSRLPRRASRKKEHLAASSEAVSEKEETRIFP